LPISKQANEMVIWMYIKAPFRLFYTYEKIPPFPDIIAYKTEPDDDEDDSTDWRNPWSFITNYYRYPPNSEDSESVSLEQAVEALVKWSDELPDVDAEGFLALHGWDLIFQKDLNSLREFMKQHPSWYE